MKIVFLERGNSNKVTIGPCLTSVICPFILKSFKTFSNNVLLTSVFRLFSISMPGFLLVFSSNSKDGNLKEKLALSFCKEIELIFETLGFCFLVLNFKTYQNLNFC